MKKKKWMAILGLTLAVVLAVGLTVTFVAPNQGATSVIGQGQKSFTIGHIAYAAGEADYYCDGTDDNVQFQAALDALPSGGGKIVVLAGTYSFSATVTRAIDNVVIQGVGRATNITYNASTPVFTAGGNNWVFRGFITDAGGVNLGATTGWTKENLAEGSDYMALQVSGNITPSANNTYALGSDALQWSELHVSGGSIYLGGIELEDNDGCLGIPDLHVHGDEVAGRAGYLKMNAGTVPTHLDAGHSILWSDNATDTGNLYWQTDNGTNLEVVRFDSIGRLGIGTNTPDELLQLIGNNASIKIEDDSGNYAILKVGNSQFTIDTDPDDAVTSTDIVFRMDGSEVARFYVGGGGSFGIGTMTPDAKLEVVGDVKFSAWETQSLTTDGYAQIGSLLVQWGSESSTQDTSESFTFPMAFPNACLAVMITRNSGEHAFPANTKSTTGFTVNRDDAISNPQTFQYIAIGW